MRTGSQSHDCSHGLLTESSMFDLKRFKMFHVNILNGSVLKMCRQ